MSEPTLEQRVAELERKINLLADRVLHYYNHTTPEIDKLERKTLILEQEVAALAEGLERLGPIIGHRKRSGDE